MTPYEHITLIGGFWNCAERAGTLLTAMRPWFKTIIITVQESEDDTYEVVSGIADLTLKDPWYGHGNPSFQKANANVKTPWSFLISDDEIPDEELLTELPNLAISPKYLGYWFHFRSWIDDIEFTREQDNHLRMWRSHIPWPPTIHSRPMIDMEDTAFVKVGNIEHRRSLDEMMSDYLRRYEIGKGDKNWDAHNIRMINKACEAVANHKGWDYVQSKLWWPEVSALAF